MEVVSSPWTTRSSMAQDCKIGIGRNWVESMKDWCWWWIAPATSSEGCEYGELWLLWTSFKLTSQHSKHIQVMYLQGWHSGQGKAILLAFVDFLSSFNCHHFEYRLEIREVLHRCIRLGKGKCVISFFTWRVFLTLRFGTPFLRSSSHLIRCREYCFLLSLKTSRTSLYLTVFCLQSVDASTTLEKQ